jgi:hypothetical protein
MFGPFLKCILIVAFLVQEVGFSSPDKATLK